MPGVESNSASAATFEKAPIRTVLDSVYAKAQPIVTPVVAKVTPFVPPTLISVTTNVSAKVIEISTPFVTKLDDNYAAPLYGYVNKNLISKREAIVPAISQVLPVAWIQNVNGLIPYEKLQNLNATVKNVNFNDVKLQINHFYETAVQTLLELKEKNSNSVKREEFIRDLKAKLNTQWEDKLTKPAELLYENLKSLLNKAKDNFVSVEGIAVSKSTEFKNAVLQHLKATFGESWIDFYNRQLNNYNSLYHKNIEAPANYVYQTLFTYYSNLAQKGQEIPQSVSGYLNQLKAQLGTTYSDKLEPFIHQAWDAIRTFLNNRLSVLQQAASPSLAQVSAASKAQASLVGASK